MKTIVRAIALIICAVILSTSALAHSGRTDSQGGHRDNKNASGLGYYHYHHGYGPHLHTNGICPYAQPIPSNPVIPTPTAPTTPVSVPAPMSVPVSNVPSSWATNGVNIAIATNLVPASLQSRYNQAITRAEFCALAVALYENIKGVIMDRDTFSDTADVNVEKAAAVGIVAGVGTNTFSPNAKLTREQAAVILARLAGMLGLRLSEQGVGFADNSSTSSWALGAVKKVQAAGIMGGVADNTFGPKGDYTREQSIITILRVYNDVKSIDSSASVTTPSTPPPTQTPRPTPTPTPTPSPSPTPAPSNRNTYYAEFPTVLDFGTFTGATLTGKMHTDDGMGIGYIYDEFSFDIQYVRNYTDALLDEGFEFLGNLNNDIATLLFLKGNIYVVLLRTESSNVSVLVTTGKANTVTPTLPPTQTPLPTPTPTPTPVPSNQTYYAEFPTVLDFGTFSGATLTYKIPNADGAGIMYVYEMQFTNPAYIVSYTRALLNDGFIGEAIDENNLAYMKGNIVVIISFDEEPDFIVFVAD